ncbi:MAG: hypothetical protein QOJ85_3112, partial [Solirubrobacteraceae bacterium]|nr:hypothetical protein [Solirubrobacteraceae bacterium]
MGWMWRAATVCLLAVGVGACGSSAHDPNPSTTTVAQTPPGKDAKPVVRPGAVLSARLTGRLPAPVQLPAVAPRGNGLLMIGGLNAADGSVADIVQVDGSRTRMVGRLPVALHDAAAATAAGRTLFIGGGNAGAGSDQVLRLTSGRQARPYARLPAGAS